MRWQGIAGLCALLVAAAGDPLAAQDPRRRLPRAIEPQVFLRAEAVPRNPYVGQQVLYTLYLYTEVDVGSIRPEGLPDFRGFWSRTLPQPGFVPQPVDDRGLYRVVLLQEAIFPRRGGRFEIPPIEATMEATVRDRVSGSRSPRVHDLTRESNPVTVEVRELPPAPALFRGAVGELALFAELAPRELEVGEAATLTVTVSGRGHLQGIPAPELPGSGRPALAGLEVFPPQQQSAEKLEGTTVAGSRTWSYVVVPERPGEWRLAPIEMTYFDPREERYRTARGPELALVAGSSRSLAQESGQTVELHPIRTAALPVAAGGGIAWPSLRPWLFGLPWVLGWVLLSVRRRRGEVGHAGVREELVQGLRSAAAESRPRPAAARIEEAWRDFLEARWGIPRGTPSTRWGSLLADRGVDREVAAGLVELADDLHYLRYAPKLSAAEGLRRELQDRSQKLLRGLR